MGKQKKQRRRPHKENPTGLPSVKDFEATEAENVIDEDRSGSGFTKSVRRSKLSKYNFFIFNSQKSVIKL